MSGGGGGGRGSLPHTPTKYFGPTNPKKGRGSKPLPPRIPTTNPVSSNPRFVDSQDMNNLSKWYANAEKNPAAPPVKNGDGGNAIMGGPAVDPNKATNDLLDGLYSGLLGQVSATGTKNAGLYDAALKSIEANYAKTGTDRYKQYTDNRDITAEGAKNLGIHLDTSSIGKNQDLAMRRIEEMSDSNLNSDQSYLEKMKALDSQGISSLLTGIQQELVTRKSTEAANLLDSRSGGSGSGSRGSGSGGGGGSGVKTSAKDTSTAKNVGDNAAYLELLQSDPKAAQKYYDAYLASEGSPMKAVNMINEKQKKPDIEKIARDYQLKMGNAYSKSRKPGQQNMYLTPKEQAAAAAKKNAPGVKAIQALLGISGFWGNNNTTQTITNTAKKG